MVNSSMQMYARLLGRSSRSWVWGLILSCAATPLLAGDLPDLPGNRQLGSIFNNDTDNILAGSDPKKPAAEVVADYRRALDELLAGRPGVLAQNVGMPDPVIYRSAVATPWSKYVGGNEGAAMQRLVEQDTDPLVLTIEACRKHRIPIVASYRMNAEDFYEKELEIDDFSRQHRHLAIPGAYCLDPLHPEVFQHRMKIFREVVEKFDVDGIEFDFRRWTHMVSDPLNNHPVLTKMVRETRVMLREVAAAKGKKRLLLGVRVGPSLATPQAEAQYDGAGEKPVDGSCKELGLDVKTWIEEELVDYVCPSLFWPSWPGMPKTREFADLAKGRDVGIYPTLFPRPEWLNDTGKVPNRGPIEPEDTEKLKDYKEGFCSVALKMYDDGADGISTFNWYFHLHLSQMPRQWQAYYGYGMGGSRIQKHVLSLLGDREALQQYREQPAFWP